MKTCPNCNERPSRSDAGWCTECKTIAARQYRKDRPWGYRFANIKGRAKRKGLAFDLDLEFIQSIWTGQCALLEVDIDFKESALDRIDNTKGYTKDNVWWVSNRANMIKRDASLEELELLVENLRKELK